MDVELYIYDLSRGLARQFSSAFLGTHIDAVYHTSLVVGGVEYFFGAGIQYAEPGSTHHGQPMEVVPMGRTELDAETIEDYLHSMRDSYSRDSYDLFLKNCNDFTNDFSQFLVGKCIPDYITSLPQTVLETPFGQMLKPQLDQAMRGITQAPTGASPRIAPSHTTQSGGFSTDGISRPIGTTKVQDVATMPQLSGLLGSVSPGCAVIFFTSKSCSPCKICYPTYESLAMELEDQVNLIRADVQVATDIAQNYHVRATPTFMTFLHGEKFEEWKGADVNLLEQKIRLLVQMAHPAHAHSSLRLPTLERRYEKPILYSKVPPVKKIITQLGDAAADPQISSLIQFVQLRFSSPSESVPVDNIPNMKAVSMAVQAWLPKTPPSKLFSLIDLLRIAAVDPRVSDSLSREPVPDSVLLKILEHITGDEEFPYSTHITAVQFACNLFSSEIYPLRILADDSIAEPLVTLIAISLLDDQHVALRVSAASLAFNVTAWNHKKRLTSSKDLLKEGPQIELAASLVEAISREADEDALKGLVLALGLLAYQYPANGELKAVLTALDTSQTIGEKKLHSSPGLLDEVKQVVS